MRDYGGALKRLRKSAGLTQAQLAEKLNVTYQAVSKWENNINQPDLESLEKICETFSVTVDEFLRMSEKGNEKDGKAPEAKTENATEPQAKPESVPPPIVKPAPAVAPQVRPGWVMTTAKKPATVAIDPEVKRKNDKKTLAICLWVGAASLALYLISFFILFGIAQTHKRAITIANELTESVFAVRPTAASGTKLGSGFFIDKNGTAVTDYSLIEDAKSIKIVMGDGYFDVDKIIGIDTVHGLAIIHVDVKSSVPVKIAKSGKIKAGDKVCVVGSGDLTGGRISDTAYEAGGNKYIQTDFKLASSSRGSVLTNSSGKVIGIVTGQREIGGIVYTDLSVPIEKIAWIESNVNLGVKEYYTLKNKKVKITYMLDGKQYGTCEVSAISDHKPPVPTAEFAEFDGWYTSADYTEKYEFTGKFDRDLNLYGRMIYSKPVVSFDIGEANGKDVPDMMLEADSVLPGCDAKYEGYTFGGWKYDGRLYAAGDRPELPAGEKYTFAAEWKPIEYTVTYDCGDDKTSDKVAFGEEYRLSSVRYTRTGYKHTGWEIFGKEYPIGGRVKNLTAVDGRVVTATPIWRPITFYAEIEVGMEDYRFDGSWKSDETITIKCTYGVDSLAEHELTAFSGGMVVSGYTVFNDDGSEYTGYFGHVTEEEGKTVKVRANWTSGPYRLYLRVSGKDVYMVELSGETQHTLPTFESLGENNPGYEFDKWKNDAYSGNELDEKYFFEDGATVSDMLSLGRYWNGSGCYVRLEAVWTPIEYTVSFDGGEDAIGEMESLDCKYSKSYILPQNTFTRDGYAFAGWKLGDTVYKEGSTVSNLTTEKGATATLTACWIVKYAGEGTETDPYKISNFDELKRLSQWVEIVSGADSAYYELSADIDCDGGELAPILKFGGGFDGKGYVISDPKFVAQKDTVGVISYGKDIYGLFGKVTGKLSNIGIENYTLCYDTSSSVYIAPLCVSYVSGQPIENCYASGSVVVEKQGYSSVLAAGLLGTVGGGACLNNCYARGSISVDYTVSSYDSYSKTVWVGGLVARALGGTNYENCYSDVDVSINDGMRQMKINAGGFVGEAEGSCKFENCFAAGDISLRVDRKDKYSYTGLFVGYNHFAKYGVAVCGKIDIVTVVVAGGAVESSTILGTVPEKGQQTADRENLCSLVWLKDNLAFDDTVWTQSDDGLPTLAVFVRDPEETDG